MNTKLQNVQIRKHHRALGTSPVWWLSLILVAFLLSCFPEQLAEYLVSQDVNVALKSEQSECKACAADQRSLPNSCNSPKRSTSPAAKPTAAAHHEEELCSAKDLPVVELPNLPEVSEEQSPPSAVPMPLPEPAEPTTVTALAQRPNVPPQPLGPEAYEEAPSAFAMLAELPGPNRLFRLESESSLRERLRQEAGPGNPLRQEFPVETPVRPTTPPPARDQIHVCMVEPGFVAYRPLLFQDVNTERYGWEIGNLQPILSAGQFFIDASLLGLKLIGEVRCPLETSAGRCLPGDPVPYRLSLPHIFSNGFLMDRILSNGNDGCETCNHSWLH
jgi:hypothetical protein